MTTLAPCSLRPAQRAFTAQGGRQRRSVVTCAAAGQETDRRTLLAGLAGAALAAPLLQAQPAAADSNIQTVTKKILKENLSSPQRNGILKELVDRSQAELRKVLTAADAPACMRLLLHDAGTYDIATKTGGTDGSVVLPEELGRAENADLKPLVQRIAAAKQAIDERGARVGQQPLSWADTIVLAAKVSTQQAWRDAKIAKAKTKEGGKTIAENFGTLWPIKLGRMDSGVAAPEGRLPAASASPKEVQEYMSALGGRLGNKATFYERPTFVLWSAAQPDPAAAEEALAADPAFADWKVKYDRSRQTLSRTDYEADFVEYFTYLANLGAKFDKNAYLYDVTFEVPATL